MERNIVRSVHCEILTMFRFQSEIERR